MIDNDEGDYERKNMTSDRVPSSVYLTGFAGKINTRVDPRSISEASKGFKRLK